MSSRSRSPKPEPTPEKAPAPRLEVYRQKRDPERTPEPFGGAPATTGSSFVVQQHWARAMHYDLRLEMDGVLRSWAVPKGPSTHAEEKRLAVHVEDHPLEYANFEGVIPAGNYGAGSVIVWDRGPYGTFKTGEDVREQYARGKLELELFGHKLRGRWTLVKTSRSEKDWLLLKKADGGATAHEAVDVHPRSVITGLTVEEMRDVEAWLAAFRERLAALRAPKGEPAAKDVSFMHATAATRSFTRQGWVFEIKYDGVRVLAEKRDGQVRMLGRSGEDITARYPEIADALRALPLTRFLLDGEIVAFDAEGRPSFQRLQKRMLLTKARDIAATMAKVPVRAVFFDALALEGHDLRKLPLLQRKELLMRALPPLGIVQAGDHIPEQGEAFFNAAVEMGLEGIVGKRDDSAYVGRRSPDWIKIKAQKRQEFVIGGCTEPRGGRARFGALHVGLYTNGQLVHVTRVGSGFDDATLDAISRALEPLKRKASPFANGPGDKGNTWVEPKLVCEVRYTEWTADGGLRHPIFLGLRTDRKPEECVKEIATEADATSEAADVADEPEVEAPAPVAEPREVHLTNLKKVFWPKERYTKGDLIAYYDAVAPLVLPYLRERPVVLTRYPDGIEGKSFYQKDAPVYVPAWVRTETVYSKDTERDIRFFVLDDAESLRYVANLGTIPIHTWSSRCGSLDRPDWVVLDLDPKGAPFAHVVEVAQDLHALLGDLEIPHHVKTSGASGLHILMPLGRRYGHEEARTFARVLAMLEIERKPKISTVTRQIHAREGKVYVDWGQNGYGITIAGPYSLRPVPGASASCPLEWDEVNAKLDPLHFNLRTIPKRFETMKDPLLPVLGEGLDIAATIARIEERVHDAGAAEPEAAPRKTRRKR